ncbi:hypothetical protein ABZU22_23905 [Micromonospora sp. NPDC005222]|uniref:hypothetical protein n=1 Tax=Micromonospora sp. NPDC005222 TaxID=3157025 RepID=UPI0033A2F218
MALSLHAVADPRSASAGVMRIRPWRHIDRDGSQAIISVAASLSSMFGVAWRVDDRASPCSVGICVDMLRRSARGDAPLRLPTEAREWFGLTFEVPEAAYALAFILVWSLAATDASAEPSRYDPLQVAMWHVTHLLPMSARRVLPDVEEAMRTAGQDYLR